MSDFFEWDAGKYGLNIPEIDEDHQEIIQAMNDLHRLHESKAGRPQLAKAMDLLKNVTATHFSDEEAYMESIGYADLRKHRHVHKHLLERLEGFRAEFQTKGELSPELFMFLKMWLKSHICGIDTQYANQVHAA